MNSLQFTYNEQFYEFFGNSKELVFNTMQREQSFINEGLLAAVRHLNLKCDLVVDIGANIGNHSIYFASQMNCKVIAFEPDKENYQHLLQNIKTNSLQQEISPKYLGVGKFNGSGTIIKDELNNYVLSSAPNAKEAIKINALDSIEFKQPIHILRLGYKDGNIDILRGGKATIAKFKPLLLLEAKKNTIPHDVIQFLWQFEYQPILLGGGSDYYAFCHRSQVNAYNQFLMVYYTNKYEKDQSLLSEKALAFAKEYNRMKSIISQYYSKNFELRKQNAALELQLKTKILTTNAWEEAYSKQLQIIKEKDTNLWKKILTSFTEAGLEDASKVKAKIEKEASRGMPKGLVSPQIELSVSSVTPTPTEVDLFIHATQWEKVDTASIQLKFSSLGVLAHLHKVTTANNTPADDSIHKLNDKKDLFNLLPKKSFIPCLVIDLDSPILWESFIDYVWQEIESCNTLDVLVADGVSIQDEEVSVFQLTDKIETEALSIVPTSLNFAFLQGIKNVLILPQAAVNPEKRQQIKDLAHKLNVGRNYINESSVEEEEFAKILKLSKLSVGITARQALATQLPSNQTEINNSLIQSYEDIITSVEVNKPLEVALVGRIHPERWHKGGIYTSCVKYAESLERSGIAHDVIEIDQDFNEIVKRCNQAKLVIIYTGDQIAQDYYNVEPLTQYLDEKGHKVIVNASYDTYNERTELILDLLEKTSENVAMMAFASEVAQDPLLANYQHRIVTVPKTIKPIQAMDFQFAERKGIFMGDLNKFLMPRITADAEQTYRAVRQALPNEKIHFITQYKNQQAIPDWMDNYELHDFDKEIHQHFFGTRIYVHAQNYCTFEMLPVEGMLAGMPVLYKNMPQSLNSYIGDCGVRFDTSGALERAIKAVYNSPQVWSSLSALGQNMQTHYTEANFDNHFLRSLYTHLNK